MSLRIVLATGNPGKLREMRALLGGTGIEVLPQTELGVRTVAETGGTFLENALLKARNAARQTGLPALADDSGLEVNALHGAPGVHSARYAGAHGNDQANVDKLLRALQGVPGAQRSARFCCALVLVRHADDPAPLVSEATWEGSILEARRGANGFGYDPVFLAAGAQRSAAELPSAEKNRLSHRGQALRALVAQLRERVAELALPC
ncbi:MAG: RdgB/HAM1 family non-canonical purine NTP pyrophosphatase [Gammaproteobacteria bacterium]